MARFHAFDALTVGFLLILSALAVRFAAAQDVWIDETTQLSGITLGLPEMLAWLAGEDRSRFAAPDDRMPPLSYLLDWIWLRIAGDGVIGFRLFHAALGLAGLAFLAIRLRAFYGAGAAAAFAGIVALSPTVIAALVEIRSYPIFLALSCACIAYVLEIASPSWKRRWRPLAALAALSVLNAYAHFFGVVASAAFLAALLIIHLRDREALRRILFVAGAAVICCLGLIPFIIASSGLTEATPAHSGVGAYIEYLLTLAASSIHLIYPASFAFLVIGLITLLANAGAAALKGGLSGSSLSRGAQAMILVVLFGITATIAADLVSARLDAIKASYSIWLFPAIAALAAIGFVCGFVDRTWRRASVLAGFGSLLGGGAIAAGLMAAKPKLFVHGPATEIETIVAASEGPVAILYEPETPYGFAAIPLGWRSGDLAQWTLAEDGDSLERFIMGRRGIPARARLSDLDAPRTLLVIRASLNSYRDVRVMLRAEHAPPAAGPLAARLANDPAWRFRDLIVIDGYYGAAIRRFERQDIN